MIDWNKYVGIPWVYRSRDISNGGLDCHGLVVYFYKNEFNIDIPKFQDVTSSNNAEDVYSKACDNFAYESHNLTLVEDECKTGDVALINIFGYPIHVGIVVADGKKLLHSRSSSGMSEIVLMEKWYRRVNGYYRSKNN